jgi:hypothetical protein
MCARSVSLRSRRVLPRNRHTPCTSKQIDEPRSGKPFFFRPRENTASRGHSPHSLTRSLALSVSRQPTRARRAASPKRSARFALAAFRDEKHGRQQEDNDAHSRRTPWTQTEARTSVLGDRRDAIWLPDDNAFVGGEPYRSAASTGDGLHHALDVRRGDGAKHAKARLRLTPTGSRLAPG